MIEVTAPDGRTLRAYDVPVDDPVLTVVWHHGTPNVGTPPEPLLPASAARGIRWVSYDRPGYGGSTPAPRSRHRLRGRRRRGHRRRPRPRPVRGPRPLRRRTARAGLRRAPGRPGRRGGQRVGPRAVPRGRPRLVRGHQPRRHRRAARRRRGPRGARAGADRQRVRPGDVHARPTTRRSRATGAGSAGSPGEALEGGIGGMVDDDLAYVAPWGFDPATITAPVLLLHGDADRVVPSSHGLWLARPHPVGGALAAPRRRPRLGAGRRDRRPGLAALESRRRGQVNRFGAWSPRGLGREGGRTPPSPVSDPVA